MAHKNRNSKHFKKDKAKRRHFKTVRNRKRGWIYPGDLCWFKDTQIAFAADVHEKTDHFSIIKCIERVMYSDEPMVYVRRSRDGRGGVWVHHLESLGIEYVFMGNIDCLTSDGPRQRPEEQFLAA